VAEVLVVAAGPAAGKTIQVPRGGNPYSPMSDFARATSLSTRSKQQAAMPIIPTPRNKVLAGPALVERETTGNVIASEAKAAADVRVTDVEDYAGLESEIRSTVKNQLMPGTKVEMTIENLRLPLTLNLAQIAVLEHAQRIYSEFGNTLKVVDSVSGGGTDAAFAAAQTTNPVLERFGLLSFGAPSNDDEYIQIDSIEPRLYLATRLIMDFSRDLVRR